LLNANKSIKVDGLEKSIIDKCKQRIIAVGVIFFVSFIAVNIKLIDISKPLKTKEHTTQDFKKYIKRGNILDRNGILLAVSMPTWSLYKDKNIIYNIDIAKRNILNIIPTRL
jgi:cell division protein FtsI/penicillin-binding protein 2